MGHMETHDTTVQRSFRLSRRTLELLEAMAQAVGASRNSLADRLLGEAIRTETHPLIRFQTGAAGRRQPLLAGTRLYVHQIITTLRANDNDIAATAEYLGVHPRQVQAAVAYYADFSDEVDDDEATAQRLEREERARWERQRRVLT
jgi:uncharacterized protein (DUF433 family)